MEKVQANAKTKGNRSGKVKLRYSAVVAVVIVSSFYVSKENKDQPNEQNRKVYIPHSNSHTAIDTAKVVHTPY